MSVTPLEPWILSRVGHGPASVEAPGDAIACYQLRRLRETIDYARQKSSFYRRRLAGFSGAINSADDVTRLPFTSAADLQGHDLDFLCVSQSEVARVVTLQSSGTTAARKRLHFTEEDLERTVDFYHHGMSTLVGPGERVLILMPGALPGSVGDLLGRALPRLGAEGIVHGLVNDPAATIELIASDRIDVLIGLPIQILGLARHPQAKRLRGRLKNVLTSADHLPEAVVEAVREVWGVPVFDHYGMTEMGLGGGVDCAALCGYHLREADFYWEVVDPHSGKPLPPGAIGEVVFTTLTRRGMPLIRYRSGDRARFLSEPCPCGSILRRLERVSGRFAGDVRLAGGGRLNITEIDEALLSLPFLINYHPVLTAGRGRERLELALHLQEVPPAAAASAVQRRLEEIPAVRDALEAGELQFGSIAPGPMPIASGAVKRRLEDRRKEQP